METKYYEPTTSQTTKHPAGGYLRGEASPNGLSLNVHDTRKIDGKRRSIKAVVYQRGSAGWEVVKNPGENYEVLGQFKTMTAWAAYELAFA